MPRSIAGLTTCSRVSREIHAHPELAYEEHFAHDVLTEAITGAGLPVTSHAYGLDTAFVSVTGPGDGPLVAVLCEYDALPGIGHACGHNIIAAAGLGAGLAAAVIADALGGRVMILGTPAEEGGGGKQKLIDAGAFDGVLAAMMVHPASSDLPTMAAIAIQNLTVRYFGRAAHAAASPWQGTNALDAAVLGYMNVAALRQHILPTERIHGIFLRAGDKPNIVPDYAEAFWYVRSKNLHTAPTAEGAGPGRTRGRRARHRLFGRARVGRDSVRRHGRQRPAARALHGQRGAARPGHRRGRRGHGGGRLDRHGQRQLLGPRHPSDDQGRPRRMRHPHQGFRRPRGLTPR